MANSTMAAKAKKLRDQKRRYPRRMDLDRRGARPNTEILAGYRERARSLGEADNPFFVRSDGRITDQDWNMLQAHVEHMRNGAKARLEKFDAPKFVCHVDTPVQRIRIYFNSRQDIVVIQQLHKMQRVSRLSKVFENIDDAYFCLNNDIVPWRVEKPFSHPHVDLPPDRPDT